MRTHLQKAAMVQKPDDSAQDYPETMPVLMLTRNSHGEISKSICQHFMLQKSYPPKLRTALNAKYEFVHPEQPTIIELSHIEWMGRAIHPKSYARNAVFYGDKAIDRSPCGTRHLSADDTIRAHTHHWLGKSVLE